MTVKEIALKLRVSPETVGKWIRSGKLKATKIRNQKILVYEIEESDLDTYLESVTKLESFRAG